MVQISQSDRQEMQRVAAEAMIGESEQMAAAEAVAIDDVRDVFCQHWPTIKKILQFIGDNVGGVVRWGIRGAIAAGDFLHGRVCGN